MNPDAPVTKHFMLWFILARKVLRSIAQLTRLRKAGKPRDGIGVWARLLA